MTNTQACLIAAAVVIGGVIAGVLQSTAQGPGPSSVPSPAPVAVAAASSQGTMVAWVAIANEVWVCRLDGCTKLKRN
jgi:hypothetical protein